MEPPSLHPSTTVVKARVLRCRKHRPHITWITEARSNRCTLCSSYAVELHKDEPHKVRAYAVTCCRNCALNEEANPHVVYEACRAGDEINCNTCHKRVCIVAIRASPNIGRWEREGHKCRDAAFVQFAAQVFSGDGAAT